MSTAARLLFEIIAMNQFVTLARNTNQARGIAEYAIEMVSGKHPGPSDAVLDRVEQFHLDSVACGVSALAAGANAPTVLRREALEYQVAECRTDNPVRPATPSKDGDGQDCRSYKCGGVPMFGSTVPVAPEKAV